MDAELINKVTWKIPNALALIGSAAGDEWNAMKLDHPTLHGTGADRSGS
jgi:hypothetical protein